MQTPTDKMLDRAMFSHLATELRGSLIDVVYYAVTNRPEVVMLAAGSPCRETYPIDILRSLADDVLREEGSKILGYGTNEGDTELREYIADQFRAWGSKVSADQVIITAGATQGLEMASKMLLDPGDIVIVEGPTFSNELAQFSNHGAKIVYAPMDKQGIVAAEVERAIVAAEKAGERVKFVYTIANFQNPTGLTMSLARRKELIDVVTRHGVMILEDDAYGALRYEGEHLPPLYTLDDTNSVMFVGTFSKTVSPGMRVGWLLAPQEIANRVALARQTTDVSASTLAQRIVARFARSGELKKHVQDLCKVYGRKRNALFDELKIQFGDDKRVSWTDTQGGFFTWMTVDEDVSAEELVYMAIDEGVAFIPGYAFDFRKTVTNQLRISFSFPPEEELREGVRRLKKTLDRYRAEKLGRK